MIPELLPVDTLTAFCIFGGRQRTPIQAVQKYWLVGRLFLDKASTLKQIKTCNKNS